MAREMDSIQAARVGRSHIAPVVMAKLTTYSDRTAGTVDEVFYFSNIAIDNYDYGATGSYKNFLPVIIGGSDFLSAFTHIPDPDDLTAFQQSFDLQLSNYEINGSRLVALLQAHNLEGASIEISQLLLPSIDSSPIVLPQEEHRSRKLGVWYTDIYDGLEHTVLFRGRVARVAPISDPMLTLQCRPDLPSMADSWIYASDDSITDPIDLGKRLPRIYGTAKRVPLLNYDVGWVTTIIEALDASETGSGYKITDGSGFPTGSFTIRIDGEEIACSTAADTTLTIVTRGANSTTAAAHNPGALIVELVATATYVVSDRKCDALTQLYAINPINGTLLRLDSAATPWTTTLSDTTTISGETITTVKFTAAQLSTLMDFFKAQAEAAGAITIQPEFATTDTEVIQVPFTSVALDSTSPFNPGSASWASANCDIDYLDTSYASADQSDGSTDAAYIWIGSAPNGSRSVYRYRVVWKTTFGAHFARAERMVVSYRFFGEVGSDDYNVLTSDPGASGMIRQTAWEYPTSKTMADVERSSAPTLSTNDNFLSYYTNSLTSAGDSSRRLLNIEGSYLEIELDPITITRTTNVAASSGASVGFGLRFFADVSGIEAAALTPVYELAEGFESGSWSATNGSVAISALEVDSGSNALAVTWDADAVAGSIAFSTEALSGWVGEYCSIALDAAEGHRDPPGSYAIEVSASNATNTAVAYWRTDTFDTVEGFESGTWNSINATSAAITADKPYSGSNSLKVTFDVNAEGTLVESCDALTGWTSGSYDTLSVSDTDGHNEGSGCLKLYHNDGINTIYMQKTVAWDFDTVAGDGTGRLKMAADIKVKRNGAVGGVVQWGFSSTTPTSGWMTYGVDITEYPDDEWVTVILGVDTYSYKGAGFSPANISLFQLAYQPSGSGAVGMTIYLDNIRHIREDTVLQNNAIGTVDMTAVADDYRIYYFCDGDKMLSRNTDVWLSSATWSGTTLGTDYWLMPLDPADAPNEWQAVSWTGSITTDGTPVISAIKSMRIELRNSDGIYSTRDLVITHYFDAFGVANPLTGPSGDMSLDLYGDNRDMLMFDFKIKKAGTTGPVEFRIGIDADNYHHTGTYFDVSDFTENTWVTILLSIGQMTEVGTNDLTDLNWFTVVFNQANRSASCQIYLDNIKFVPQDTIVQNNAIGGSDFTSTDNLYQLAVHSDTDDMTERNVWAWIASATWTGTAIGTDYRRLQFIPAATADAWQSLAQTGTYTDGGSPTLSSIASMRFCVRNSPGIYTRDPVNVHYIDSFKINNPTTSYSVASGSCLVHPADILLHWINEIGGEQVEATSLAALLTSLGASAAWGFDARTLGFSWEEVLQRMAFEARCNVVPIETSTRREWKLLAANSGYGFGTPSASSVITQTHAMTDVGRSVDDLASYYSFRYAFDASLPGNGSDESFRLALLATPDVSDVPITTTLIGNAAARFGALQADPVAFRCIQATATAQDVAGYLVQERMANQRRVFVLEDVAWFDALPYDVGDVVSITPPWSSTAVTCRITSLSKSFLSNAWTITAVQVLETGTHT